MHLLAGQLEPVELLKPCGPLGALPRPSIPIGPNSASGSDVMIVCIKASR